MRADRYYFGSVDNDHTLSDYHRAWIEPNGTFHEIGGDARPMDTHYQWVKRSGRKNIVPAELQGRSPDETQDKMLTAGWVKKHSGDMYAGHRSAVKTVHAHFTKHHPHMSRVSMEIHGEGDIDGRIHPPVVTDTGELQETYSTPSHDEPSDFAEPQHRGWISPEGELHKLSDTEKDVAHWPTETHLNWIQRNPDKIEKAVGSDGAGDPFDSMGRMMSAGWIRKAHSKHYEVGHPDSIAMVRAHVKEHHPEHKSVKVFCRYSSKSPFTHPAREIRVNEATAGTTVSQFRQRNFPTEHRGWIDHNNSYHHIGAMQTHGEWSSDNGVGDLFTTLGLGWLRKSDKNQYHGNNLERLPDVMRHVREHHSELKTIRFISDMAGEKVYHLPVADPSHYEGATHESLSEFKANDWEHDEYRLMPESSGAEFKTAHRGWIKSDDSYHQLGAMGFHGASAEESFPHAKGASSIVHAIRSGGWIRKADKNQYHSRSLDDLPRVMRHVREHHPEVKNIHFIAGSESMTADRYNLPVKSPEYYQSTGEDSLKQYRSKKKYSEYRLMPEGRADTLITQGLGESWMNERHAAWISPQGEVHYLEGGEYHTNWIRQNADKISSDIKDKYSDGDLDEPATQDNMIGKGGWIRKQDKGIYHAHEDQLDAIHKHFTEHHPDQNQVEVRLRDADGPRGKSVYLYKDGTRQGSNESRVDSLISRLLTEAWRGGPLSAWLSKRHGGWISPKGVYHKMEKGEHHREWVSHPRNGRALMKIFNTLAPHLHGDEGAVQAHMQKNGWIRKLDHDQYIVGRHADMKRAVDHFNAHHGNRRSMEVGVENYPSRGEIKRFYFNRDPNTQSMLPRKKFRDQRSRVGTSERQRKWRSTG